MRDPDFWRQDGAFSRLLAPAGAMVAMVARRRQRRSRPFDPGVPVICIGNLVAGGAGKTPVALSLGQRLAARGLAPAFLTRGYGGRLEGPLLVDPERHTAAEVGDEPLLLVRLAPTVVAQDRVVGAKLALEQGAGTIVMDDGFQNPSLLKRLSLLVVDGTYGLGNGRVMPAGPLRESLRDGLARADAVVLLGEAPAALETKLAGPPLLRASLQPIPEARRLRGERVLAFAGIGRPEKFFATLEALGAELVDRKAFPDHHPYTGDELTGLESTAKQAHARLVTTEKDAARLPRVWRLKVSVVPVAVAWENAAALEALLDGKGFAAS